MTSAGNYSAHEHLRDGRRFLIRALVPDDRAELIAATKRTSGASMFRRFFSMKSEFTENEISYFTNIDFVSHVALIAVLPNDGADLIIGGGRYIVSEPGRAELAFVITDVFQGQGVGSALLRHLVLLGRDSGVKTFLADVLPENRAMLKVFKGSGLPMRMTREPGVTHVNLLLDCNGVHFAAGGA